MLYVYNKVEKAINQCPATYFRDHGILERQDLEKWVEVHPDILGEELLVVTTEYDKFDRTNERLDLLALDRDGNLVVIELKRDDSGKNVDLQALKYAAYCSTLVLTDLVEMFITYHGQRGRALSKEDAENELRGFISNSDFVELNDRPRIILVAHEFRTEVTASVLWLRQFGIDISCVKWALYLLEENQIALNSSVLIPLPEAEDFLIQAQRKEGATSPSTTQMEYVSFYSRCVDMLKEQIPGDYAAPKPRSYYSIPSGIPGVHFEWGFHGQPRSSFGVEVHFEKANPNQNRALLQACLEDKSHIEAALEESVFEQPEWARSWSRLYVEKQQGEITDDLAQWAVDKMARLIRLVRPLLGK